MSVPQETTVPILRTKLHRPAAPADLVCRERLHARLDEGRRLPLTLVSAPPGFGKSTLVAHWLAESEHRGAWLSLDETDSDLRTFLHYVVAALRTVEADACPKLLLQLGSDELPLTVELSRTLGNDLEALSAPIVLVLDDYQVIQDPAIHELLDHLLKHPSPSLHLVILSRRNPPLSLATLRGRHRLNEIRMQELHFTLDETAAFIESATGRRLNAPSLAHLHESTEGWPVGLRLAALALRDREDADAFVSGFGGDSREVHDYLLGEVLANLPERVREWLCRTSVLDRFCAPLCEAVCRETSAPGTDLEGRAFVDELEGKALLFVALDERHEWYRYHHLFRELLRRELESQLSGDEMAELHRRAAAWLEAQGLFEEALQHLVRTGDAAAAGRLVARQRQELANQEQWTRLAGWLELLPRDLVDRDLELLILRARCCDKQGRYAEWVQALDRAEELLAESSPTDEGRDRQVGEVTMMRALVHYHQAQGQDALAHAERALELLPPEAASERAYASIGLAVSLQMQGQLKRAYAITYEALEREGKEHPTFHGRLLQTICFLHWIAADLPGLERAAATLLEVGEKHGLAETIRFARYFLGAARYHLGELDAAELVLRPVAADHYGPPLFIHLMSVEALALIHQARGEPEAARELADAEVGHLLERGNTSLLPQAEALQAKVALRQGREAEALRWSRGFETGGGIAGYHFSVPDLTAAQVLAAQSDHELLKQAKALLEQLQASFKTLHNTRFLIETLALRALVLESQGDEAAALAALGEAVALARPGGFVRLFADLGPRLAGLLNRLDLDEEGVRHVGRVLAAMRGDGASTAEGAASEKPAREQPLIEPLSSREMEILRLLAERMSNKEIGEQLFISPVTVKRHVQNVYEKLSVHGRREAVAKATGLGIIG